MRIRNLAARQQEYGLLFVEPGLTTTKEDWWLSRTRMTASRINQAVSVKDRAKDQVRAVDRIRETEKGRAAIVRIKANRVRGNPKAQVSVIVRVAKAARVRADRTASVLCFTGRVGACPTRLLPRERSKGQHKKYTAVSTQKKKPDKVAAEKAEPRRSRKAS
jgi:hypothetical protein